MKTQQKLNIDYSSVLATCFATLVYMPIYNLMLYAYNAKKIGILLFIMVGYAFFATWVFRKYKANRLLRYYAYCSFVLLAYSCLQGAVIVIIYHFCFNIKIIDPIFPLINVMK